MYLQVFTRFQYKVTVLFHLKLKGFPWLCQKVVNTSGGNFFNQVMKNWGGVILNTEHQLKSKLAWPVCQKSMKKEYEIKTNFWLVRGTYTYVLYIYEYKRTLPTGFYIQWRNSVYIIYIMCPSGHLTSARFEHFMCHRYIWYIFSLVCSVFVIQYIYHIMFNQAQWQSH